MYIKPPYAIWPVPSLSGHAIAYRWHSLPRVRRLGASKPQEGSSERVLPWQVTMDQLMCASLSHAHYWYAVGMLKVPVMTIDTYTNVNWVTRLDSAGLVVLVCILTTQFKCPNKFALKHP